MLSKEQKEKLRKINIYDSACEEKDDVAITRKTVSKGKNGKEKISHIEEVFVIPSTYEIAKTVFKKILDCGFSKVERVSPTDANCIVRVFQKLHHLHYDFVTVFNMYGANVFVKNGTRWTAECECSGECFTLNYAKCLVEHSLYQDEKVVFDAEFFDFYIKVS